MVDSHLVTGAVQILVGQAGPISSRHCLKVSSRRVPTLRPSARSPRRPRAHGQHRVGVGLWPPRWMLRSATTPCGNELLRDERPASSVLPRNPRPYCAPAPACASRRVRAALMSSPTARHAGLTPTTTRASAVLAARLLERAAIASLPPCSSTSDDGRGFMIWPSFVRLHDQGASDKSPHPC